jgi:hypothetical protein
MRNPNVESAIERLEPLEDEYRLAGPLHAEVEELGQERLATGNLSSTKADAFGKAIASLVSMYKQHKSVGFSDKFCHFSADAEFRGVPGWARAVRPHRLQN